jgi:hypothetical protein
MRPLQLGNVPDDAVVAQNTSIRAASHHCTHEAIQDNPVFLTELHLIVTHRTLALDFLLEAEAVSGIGVGLPGVETDHLGPHVAQEV